MLRDLVDMQHCLSTLHSSSQHGSSSNSAKQQQSSTADSQAQPATTAASGSTSSSSSSSSDNATTTTAAAVAPVSSSTANNSNSNSSSSSDPHMTGNLGTVAWAAPEMFSSNASSTAVYSLPADVYSYGVVLWELWHRSGKPWAHCTSKFDIIDAVLAGERPAISSTCPRIYAALMRDCWQQQPQRRPTFAEVVKVLELELASAEDNERRVNSSKRSSSGRNSSSSSSSARQLFDSNRWPVQQSKQWASDDSV